MGFNSRIFINKRNHQLLIILNKKKIKFFEGKIPKFINVKDFEIEYED